MPAPTLWRVFSIMCGCGIIMAELGVCPSNAILLRQTICRHLHRSRPETVPAASPSRRRAQTWCDLFVAPCALNVFQRIRLRFFRTCDPRVCAHLLFLATKDYSDRLLGRFRHYVDEDKNWGTGRMTRTAQYRTT